MREHAKHKPGACPSWAQYPISTDRGDPPGTILVDGKKWYLSKAPEHGPCTMCNASGECWEPWTPAGTKGKHDPETTPLVDFPRWPVAYWQEAAVGTNEISPLRVIKRWAEVKPRGRPLNELFLDMRAQTAVRWISVAGGYATTRQQKAWIKRLRRELYAHVMQVDCTVDCRAKYRHLWLVSNAAQYLAERYSEGRMRPPYVAPSKSIIEHLATWAGEHVEQAATSKLGWYIGGGIVISAGLLYLKSR